MATKLDRVGTYYEELPRMKSHNPLITCLARSRDKLKTIIFPPPQYLWPLNLAGWWLQWRVLPIKSRDPLIIWSCKITCQAKPVISPLATSFDTRLGRIATHCERLPLLKPHDRLITWATWGEISVWKIYISTFTILMATNLSRVLTSGRRFSTQTLRFLPAFS